MNEYIQTKEENFEKIIKAFKDEIARLRTGRATASILDKVMVNSYGQNAPLNSLSSIAVQDANSMIVSPWDKNILKEIEKGIVDASLGLGVVNEGDKIRVSIPQMTEEKRKDIVKTLNKILETFRVRLRQARDGIKNSIEKAEKDKEISQDDKFRFLKDLEEFTHRKDDELKQIRDKKEEDIMTI